MDKIRKFIDITQQMVLLYEQKNNDYGDSFGEAFEELGIISAITRMNDKMNRLKSLTSGKEQKVSDEKIEDTLIDLANYAIMTLIELQSPAKDNRINLEDFYKEAMAIDIDKMTVEQILMLGEDEINLIKQYKDAPKDNELSVHMKRLTQIMIYLELNDLPEEVEIYLLEQMVKERDALAEKLFEQMTKGMR